ncbi:MAG: AMP-binding protein, partial [Elusimicrobia bacterium]|nr:AMP-binding protein [Elusimicrobiota bacterium]
MNDQNQAENIEVLLKEKKLYKPSAAFAKAARIKSFGAQKALLSRARKSPEKFWAEAAKSLAWAKPWKKILDWNPPFAKWFVGGRLNASVNCLDRHLAGPRRHKAAIVWEAESGRTRTLTYAQLHQEVCRCANALKSLGVKKGDRVGIYMPMVPEAAVAMLACARLGAAHNVVFAGFSAQALAERLADSQAKVLITADGVSRKGEVISLKKTADEALSAAPNVTAALVLKHAGNEVAWTEGRDVWWREALAEESDVCPAEAFDSEQPLFILYTSGSTGKPKGVLHTTGGYLTQAALTTRLVFDLRDEDLYWCTADVGWVTGHSYVVYGPLAEGATVLMYEGAPLYPAPDRFWSIV